MRCLWYIDNNFSPFVHFIALSDPFLDLFVQGTNLALLVIFSLAIFMDHITGSLTL